MTGYELLPILQEIFPEAQVTFGYIGNYEGPTRDYRSWKFFTKLPVVKDGLYNNRPSCSVEDPSQVQVGRVVRELARHCGRRLSVSENQILNYLLG